METLALSAGLLCQSLRIKEAFYVAPQLGLQRSHGRENKIYRDSDTVGKKRISVMMAQLDIGWERGQGTSRFKK